MSEKEEEKEETDVNPSYLIHSEVFSPTNDENVGDGGDGGDENKNRSEGRFMQHTIDFLLPRHAMMNQFDDDGDLLIERPERIHLTLVHRNETTIDQCGYQLWNGSLLLCDYILTHQDRFSHRTILELGAGLGLCSLLVSRYATKVICTDHDPELLQIIQHNLSLNEEVCRKEVIDIVSLDWKNDRSQMITDPIEIILAADVIYDDDVTDLLFNILKKCFLEYVTLQSIYFTIEKRINFYTETQSVESPAYDYFLKKLDFWKQEMPELVMEQIPTTIESIPQTTKLYQRTNELILWHVSHSKRSS